MRAARQRGPVFPAPQARGLFARLAGIKFSPFSHAFQQFTKYVSLFHLCPLRLLSGIKHGTGKNNLPGNS